MLPPPGPFLHHPPKMICPFCRLFLAPLLVWSLSFCTLYERPNLSDYPTSHSSLWLQKYIGWVNIYYTHPQDITPALHLDAFLSADAPGIPHLGILGLLMAHWELPFTVGFQRAMTGWFKDSKSCPFNLIRDNSKGPSYCQSPTKDRLLLSCNHIACSFLIYPILPSSPPYRYNSQEQFPINSAHHSPSLSLFPGNSIQGTLGLYVGHHYCHTHLVQLAFPNKPQQVNIEPRESDVRHELKLWKGGNHKKRDSSPTPGVSGAETTWDFKSHMLPHPHDTG